MLDHALTNFYEPLPPHHRQTSAVDVAATGSEVATPRVGELLTRTSETSTETVRPLKPVAIHHFRLSETHSSTAAADPQINTAQVDVTKVDQTPVITPQASTLASTVNGPVMAALADAGAEAPAASSAAIYVQTQGREADSSVGDLDRLAPKSLAVQPVQEDRVPGRIRDDRATPPNPEAPLTEQLELFPEALGLARDVDVGQRVELSLLDQVPSDAVQAHGALVSVAVRDTPLPTLLALLAQQQGLSIVAPSGLDGRLTVTLQPTTLENALDAIMAISGCTWARVNDVIYVTPMESETIPNFVIQGRTTQMFNLNYVSAKDVESVVSGLLSPVGKAFVREMDSKDKRKALEQVVVEDLPGYVARIADYIAQADQPPLQVIVEVRVLQVKLVNEHRHGLNFEHLARSSGPEIWLRTQTFAADDAPGAVFTLGGSHFEKLLELLTSTTDAKTLAAPRLLMINGQESRIQIGRRLAFSTSTTTQTVTVQDVQFLDVGVLLNVTPLISEDGKILMNVNPKVSAGEINPNTQLPEEETTELETTIMVPQGHGVIIGGLIQESDVERQSKVPGLGDLWVVGRLFQKRSVTRERSEVVVALLPRIVPWDMCPTPAEAFDLHRVEQPVLTPDLKSAPRVEPRLPDAIRKPSWPRR